ncbi:MAG: preprotein translocase subunit YajC [Clostridia bacterium]|nr:preprotein translocase subunit YajC [Clostridia bacterium]
MGNYGTWIWLLVMVAVFYFLIIRPQKKREKSERELRNSIQAGDEIVTIGGFVGRVLSVKDDTVTFETGADRTKLTVKKWAIQTRTSPAQEVKEEPAKVEETPAEAAEAETPKKKKFFGK